MKQIFWKFHLSFYNDLGNKVEDPKEIFKIYSRDMTGLLVDVVAALPVDIFALAAPPGKRMLALAYLRLLRVLRYYHINRFFTRWETELNIKCVLLLGLYSLLAMLV